MSKDETSMKTHDEMSDSETVYFKSNSNTTHKNNKDVRSSMGETERRYSAKDRAQSKRLSEKDPLKFISDHKLRFGRKYTEDSRDMTPKLCIKSTKSIDLYQQNLTQNSPLLIEKKVIFSKNVALGKKVGIRGNDSNCKSNSRKGSMVFSDEQKGLPSQSISQRNKQGGEVSASERKSLKRIHDCLISPEKNIMNKRLSQRFPILGSNKTRTELDCLNISEVDQTLSGKINPSDRIQTPLPTMTCSKRLNNVKSSLNFSKDMETNKNGEKYSSQLPSPNEIEKASGLRMKRNLSTSVPNKGGKLPYMKNTSLMMSKDHYKSYSVMLYDNNKEELLAQIKELKEKLAQRDYVNSNLNDEIKQLKVENGQLRGYVNDLIVHNLHHC